MSVAIRRGDRIGLSLVTALLFAALAAAAWHWPLSIDESWHIYFADVGPWRKAIGEWAHDTHPPLTYLLMRPLVLLGDEPFWPRLASVVPTLLLPWLLFIALRKLAVDRLVAWCVVVVATASLPVVALGVSIRSYAFATAAGGVALVASLDMLPGGTGATPARVRTAFAGIAAAVWSLVAAWLWLAAAAIAFTVLALVRPTPALATLREFRAACRRIDAVWFAIALLGAAGFVGLAVLRTSSAHVGQWFAEPGESLPGFAIRGTRGQIAAFTHVGEVAPWLVVAAAGMCVAFGVRLVVRARRAARDEAAWTRAVVVVGALVLWCCMVVAGYVGAYPFGGDMRHQFIAFPVAALSAALALHHLSRRILSVGLRRLATVAAAAVALAVTAIRSPAPPAVEFPPAAIWTEPAAVLLDSDDGVPAVLPNVGFIGVYGQVMDRRWRFVERLGSWDLFTTDRPVRRVYRHRNVWSLASVPSQRFLAGLRELAVARGESRLRLWTVRLSTDAEAGLPVADDATVRSALDAHGFELATRTVTDDSEVLELVVR